MTTNSENKKWSAWPEEIEKETTHSFSSRPSLPPINCFRVRSNAEAMKKIYQQTAIIISY